MEFKPKNESLLQTTQTFSLFRIAQSFFLPGGGSQWKFGSVVNALQIAVRSKI